MFYTFSSRKNWIVWTTGSLALFSLLAFTEKRLRQHQCKAILVEINQPEGQQFLNRKDVTAFLTNNGEEPLIGQPIDAIDLSKLEQRLGQFALIKKAHVSFDLAGNLLANITEPDPIARLVRGGSGARVVGGQYITREGRFIPLSMNYSARVPVVSGSWFRSHRTLKSPTGQELLTLFRYINETPLWRAQIAEIAVDSVGEVTLWPQVGTYKIEFGVPQNIETKFDKVKLFYTQIAPQKGWSRYHRVNVQYRNQLVCE